MDSGKLADLALDFPVNLWAAADGERHFPADDAFETKAGSLNRCFLP